jgi:hypothetical protein
MKSLLACLVLASVAGCSSSGDTTELQGGDAALKHSAVGCRSGFPNAGDPCSAGESCVAEGDCNTATSLPVYECKNGHLMESGQHACPKLPDAGGNPGDAGATDAAEGG